MVEPEVDRCHGERCDGHNSGRPVRRTVQGSL